MAFREPQERAHRSETTRSLASTLVQRQPSRWVPFRDDRLCDRYRMVPLADNDSSCDGLSTASGAVLRRHHEIFRLPKRRLSSNMETTSLVKSHMMTVILRFRRGLAN